MPEPKWLTDLDRALGHHMTEENRMAAWLTWAIHQLPPDVRKRAAAAMARGDYPSEGLATPEG